MAVYRVVDGFARGGMLIFEIETLNEEVCLLSIYVAFNFARGRNWLTRSFWALFRLLFPAYIHDVLWNHSLCQLKDLVEADQERERRGQWEGKVSMKSSEDEKAESGAVGRNPDTFAAASLKGSDQSCDAAGDAPRGCGQSRAKPPSSHPKAC